MSQEPQVTEREAEMTELLAEFGPMTSRDLATALFGALTKTRKPWRSHAARAAQSLRNLERDGIVTRQGWSRKPEGWVWGLRR